MRSLGFVAVNSSRPQSVFSMKRQTTKVLLQLFFNFAAVIFGDLLLLISEVDTF